jgi:F0F1-type ATP synthase gamma subunit
MTMEKLEKGKELIDRINSLKSDIHSLDEAIKQNAQQGRKRVLERLIIKSDNKYGETSFIINTSDKELCGDILSGIWVRIMTRVINLEKEFDAL